MNRKQRKRQLKRRQKPPVSRLSPAMEAYKEVKEKAKKNKKGPTYIATQMQKRGFLPNGDGNWRPMTEREKEMWR